MLRGRKNMPNGREMGKEIPPEAIKKEIRKIKKESRESTEPILGKLEKTICGARSKTESETGLIINGIRWNVETYMERPDELRTITLRRIKKGGLKESLFITRDGDFSYLLSEEAKTVEESNVDEPGCVYTNPEHGLNMLKEINKAIQEGGCELLTEKRRKIE